MKNLDQVGGNHYKDMAIEPWEYAEANNLSFLEGTVVKYVSRHKSKGGVEDLKKAIHCLELLIESQKKESVDYQYKVVKPTSYESR